MILENRCALEDLEEAKNNPVTWITQVLVPAAGPVKSKQRSKQSRGIKTAFELLEVIDWRAWSPLFEGVAQTVFVSLKRLKSKLACKVFIKCSWQQFIICAVSLTMEALMKLMLMLTNA